MEAAAVVIWSVEVEGMDLAFGWILTTGRLAEECDPRWVAAEGCDVVSYPFDRKTLIEQAYVLGHSWKSREAEHVDTVAEFVSLI